MDSRSSNAHAAGQNNAAFNRTTFYVSFVIQLAKDICVVKQDITKLLYLLPFRINKILYIELRIHRGITLCNSIMELCTLRGIV
jgi:hypothetical protein